MQGPGTYPRFLETLSLIILAKSSIFDVQFYNFVISYRVNFVISLSFTAQEAKFSIKDFFSKWSHLLKKSLMENFIFCVVLCRISPSPKRLFTSQSALTFSKSTIEIPGQFMKSVKSCR